ncbi:MAG: putative toxin-antitoxin system toxin component, PIN family [Thermoleophilia bacterium]|nr:putative toxin-antitoxin system toxin component, PIN family [Thermoleophilia bacterium]
MLRVVIDANVFVSALLRRDSVPANVLHAWENGLYELVVSAALLDELESVLRRPHIARRIAPAAATDLLAVIRSDAILANDPPPVRHVPSDPDDDFLIALALAAGAQAIGTGDEALLALELEQPRILTPREFLTAIEPMA